jgi:hypothetical protein
MKIERKKRHVAITHTSTHEDVGRIWFHISIGEIRLMRHQPLLLRCLRSSLLSVLASIYITSIGIRKINGQALLTIQNAMMICLSIATGMHPHEFTSNYQPILMIKFSDSQHSLRYRIELYLCLYQSDVECCCGLYCVTGPNIYGVVG